MRTVPLGEVTAEVETHNPTRTPNQSFTYIDLSALDNQTKSITSASHLAGSDAPSRARQIVRAGDVLVSTVRPNLNAVAHIDPDLDGAVASTGFTVLRPSTSLNGRYLFHWVQTQSFVSSLVRKATGASYPAVTDRIIKNETIPFPPLTEQRRIAAILDQADSLRIKRRAQLEQLDALPRAFFQKEFPPGAFPVKELNQIATITSGITKGRKTSEPTSSTPYLAVANVQAGSLNLGTVKEIAATSAEIERYSLHNGDVVVTEGGDPDKLGRGTIWRSELPICLHQNHIFRVRLNLDSGIEPEFLEAFLQSKTAKQYFLRSAKQTTGIASINMTQLKRLPVPVPTTTAQEVFTQEMKTFRNLTGRLRTSATHANELFSSLQSQAFRGEL